ncbi:SDR family NAD(P)-dependent oxidoreductase [Leptospira sp. GIMC2001]|uniref:SDR family NAD(P)-dependent oxidoreductase n=1 Tax=Leptospira sp. GIMC2001 TaxID=1513297 RepID=UPI00234A98A3|nr:SDR family NAD(P)-dependent oxidoreductase [Leptospira sp. GIMC2001]WCL51064.1 SDR family NAD(P)-dependent oxidoreductase [Leptospira sp. GIMC2001]
MILKDKTVLVTGSAGGLGKAMALRFGKQGSKIVLSDIQEDKLNETVEEFKKLGINTIGIQANVAKEEDAVRLMEGAVKEFGSLDVAILNAGILRDGLLIRTDKETGEIKAKMSIEQWQSVIDVNLTGVFLTGREAACVMAKQKSGVIIPIASIAMHGNSGQTNYSAAKAGVAALTVTWSKELARHGIRVAGIAPGFIGTEMVLKDMNAEALEKWKKIIPVGRLGEPDEIATTAQFIVENDLVTGVILEISGGVRI